MLNKLLFLFWIPVFAQAQPRKNELNSYHEAGITAKNKAFGLHYSWQAQLSGTLYFGIGAEAVRATVVAKETVRTDKLVPATFRLSHMADLQGIRVVPYLGAGVELAQNGTVLEGGLGVAAGKWQLSAAYRRFGNGLELPQHNGVFLRLSRLLVREAARPYFR